MHMLLYIVQFTLLLFEIAACAPSVSGQTADSEVLKALSQIIDPDFGTDIVSCGFVKDLLVDENLGEVLKTVHSDLHIIFEKYSPNPIYWNFQVSFRLELTTPACPIKDMVNETQLPLFDQELMCI